jgi:DNA-binding transcriptional LysR family regulator
MELRQLEYLVAIVEEGSFTRAAARVRVAQPGVSAQIGRLERELGQRLLNRSGREVTPTTAGAAVLPYARAALAAVGSVRETIDELSALTRGSVKLGTVNASGALGLADLLADFHTQHPLVEISLTEDVTDRLLVGLTDGSLALALVGRAGPRRSPAPGLEHRVVRDDRLAAAVRPDHPLANRDRVALRDLAELPLICVPRGTGMRTALAEGCAAAGIEPRIAFEAADPVVLAKLAGRGLGVAIMPESARTLDPSLRFVAIDRPRLRSRIELVWRAQPLPGPAARALIDAANRFFIGAEGTSAEGWRVAAGDP